MRETRMIVGFMLLAAMAAYLCSLALFVLGAGPATAASGLLISGTVAGFGLAMLVARRSG